MAKIKDGQESFITRDQYNALKKMDRPEVEAFLKTIYEKGCIQGGKDAAARHKETLEQEAALNGANQHKMSKDELLSFLTTISGIGPATMRKLKEAFDMGF